MRIMIRFSLIALIMWVTLVFSGSVFAQQTTAQENTPQQTIQPLECHSLSGNLIRIAATDQPQCTVVCFVGNECPLVRLYIPRLESIAERFADQPVKLLLVNSNHQDSESEMRQFAQTFELKLPLVNDVENRIADALSAERTPEVFVVDQNLQVVYRGRIDDQYQPGITRPNVTQHYLIDALETILNGDSGVVQNTDAVGCIIGRAKIADNANPADVTWTNQISRLLQTHCLECHRPGQIGPFAMDDYDEVVGWADMMMEVVDEGRMPPWHADPEFGTFANARNFTGRDKQLLRDWIESGTPFGDETELPATVTFTEGWRLPRDPDIVFSMRQKPFNVPADGTVEYQYYVVPTGFTEDKWVLTAEVLPGNPRVVHHSLVFVRPPDGERFSGSGWLAAYVPGQQLAPVDEAMARRIPAGSSLVFQQHYTPGGYETTDMTRIGLVFADEQKLTHELTTVIALDQDFEIPPHTAAHEVGFATDDFPTDGVLLSVSPHMHWRGKSFDFRMVQSGEVSQTMLRVPEYDFNWQHDYQFADRVPLAGVERFDLTVTFDNSKNNPVNPDPDQFVLWGDQTREEMAVAFFNVAVPIERELPQVSETPDEDRQRKIQQFADRFFERFDSNGDGRVAESETPRAISAFRFDSFDMDRDGFLSREEVELHAGFRID